MNNEEYTMQSENKIFEKITYYYFDSKYIFQKFCTYFSIARFRYRLFNPILYAAELLTNGSHVVGKAVGMFTTPIYFPCTSQETSDDFNDSICQIKTIF